MEVSDTDLRILIQERDQLKARVDELLTKLGTAENVRRDLNETINGLARDVSVYRMHAHYAKFSSLTELAHDLYAVAESKGWHPDGLADTADKIADYVPRAIANIHGEVSELWEAYRAGKLLEPCDKAPKMSEELTCAEEEIADVIIRACDASVKLGIDIGRAVKVKNEFNKTRSARHGGKRA